MTTGAHLKPENMSKNRRNCIMKKAINFILVLSFGVVAYVIIGKLSFFEQAGQLLMEILPDSLVDPDTQQAPQNIASAIRAIVSIVVAYVAGNISDLWPIITQIFLKSNADVPEISFDVLVVTLPRKRRPAQKLEEIVLRNGESSIYTWVRIKNEGKKAVIACRINDYPLKNTRIQPEESYEFYLKVRIQPPKSLINTRVSNAHSLSDRIKNFIYRTKCYFFNKWQAWRSKKRVKFTVSIQNTRNEYYCAQYALNVDSMKQTGHIHRLTKFRKGYQ